MNKIKPFIGKIGIVLFNLLAIVVIIGDIVEMYYQGHYLINMILIIFEGYVLYSIDKNYYQKH